MCPHMLSQAKGNLKGFRKKILEGESSIRSLAHFPVVIVLGFSGPLWPIRTKEDVREEARYWVSYSLAPESIPGVCGCVTLDRSLNLPASLYAAVK